MFREVFEKFDGKVEVVCDETGKVIFVKETTVHQGYNPENDMTTVSGFGQLVDMNDIGFTHLEPHDLFQGCIVDFQYVDGDPDNEFSEAKLGTLKVFSPEGRIISGESFRPGGFTRIVIDGQLMSDPNGLDMSAPLTTKLKCGKNISELKTSAPRVGR